MRGPGQTDRLRSGDNLLVREDRRHVGAAAISRRLWRDDETRRLRFVMRGAREVGFANEDRKSVQNLALGPGEQRVDVTFETVDVLAALSLSRSDGFGSFGQPLER